MERKDEAFLLASQPLGEADLILTLLTERSGRVRGVARSARKSRKRFGGSLEPMTRVRVRWFQKGGSELQRIDSLELVESYAAMQAEPAVQAACAVLAEITRSLSREGEGDARVFRLVKAVLDALRDGQDPWVAVRYFEFWMLRLQGLLPELEGCAGCGRPVAPDSAWAAGGGEGLVCRDCKGREAGKFRLLTRSERNFLREVETKPPKGIGREGEAARPGGTLEWMLRGALENFVEREFRTYRHLRAATAGVQADSPGDPS
jgi:DNA repair protein RecO (recombination protein O)